MEEEGGEKRVNDPTTNNNFDNMMHPMRKFMSIRPKCTYIM